MNHEWNELAQQDAFRQLLRAFSYPGIVLAMPCALTQTLAVLADGAVKLADLDELVGERALGFMEAAIVVPEDAHFIVADGTRAPRFEPSLGTLASPEHGATIILRVQRLGHGEPLALTGPGVDGTATLKVEGMSSAWLRQRSRWNAGFPCGVDFILVDDAGVAALPRTTRIDFPQAQGGL